MRNTDITLQYIENSLYNGELWAKMNHNRYWRVRRNGKTQTWKTRIGHYRIPVKAGLKACGQVTHTSGVALFGSDGWHVADFVISSRDPNEVRK